MAIRSILVSVSITCLLGYAFTLGLTDPDSFLKKIPDWVGIVLLLLCGVLYLMATWWAIKGFSEHKVMALLSLGFCAAGIGFYAFMFLLEIGNGKATPGQYDYDFSTLDASEKVIVGQIAKNAGVSMENAVFTEHWHIAESTAAESTAAESTAAELEPKNSFAICVQKRHVTAINFSNHPISNLSLFSQLPRLGDLYLKNCGLTDMSGLQSITIDRLDVSDNQIADLKTLRGCPNIRWLFVANNRLQSTNGIDQFANIVSTDFRGNPMP